MKKIWTMAAAAAMMLVSAASFAQEAASPAPQAAPIKFDHRGLIEITGIISANGGWGSTNLVVKPHGGWAAQDYCLKNVKKSGGGKNMTYKGTFSAGKALNMVEKTKQVKDENGLKGVSVAYNLTAQNGSNLNYERIFVKIPLTGNFAGGSLILEDGSKIEIPLNGEDGGDLANCENKITFKNATSSFSFQAKGAAICVKDLRPGQNTFELEAVYPQTGGKAINLEYSIFAEILPTVISPERPEWTPINFAHEIKEGSILDFSSFVDAPAGKYGRIINKDGHFAYEKTGKRVKLMGTNLCYEANYVSHEEADKLAKFFRKYGYNAIRFHHTDVHIRKGNWNSYKSDDIDNNYLDRLDYMLYAMKQNGLYVTIDLYTQRNFGAGEIAGVDRNIGGEIKGLVPIHEPAFNAWKKLVVKWMNHVNPYTKTAWKDEEAIVFICPLNEDSIASAWGGFCKPFYMKAFAAWQKKNGKPVAEPADPANDPDFAQFLTEVKVESNQKIEKFLKEELGVKAMLTGSNWWDTKPQTFMRSGFDVVDNHQYSDHPQPHWLPSKYNQNMNINSGNPTYMTPIMMTPTRVFGKPFTVTEYNYCMPNKYRAEGGAMMGAYAGLQDWDGLYRFAWTHGKDVNLDPAMSGFNLNSDPLNQQTERQIMLMFGRSDVAPAKQKFVYGVTMKDAVKGGIGDMWGRGLFPHPFTHTALFSQIGSCVIEGGKAVPGKFTGVVAAEKPSDAVLNGNAFVSVDSLKKPGAQVVSDTNQITLMPKAATFKIVTPKSECVVGKKGSSISGDNLKVDGLTTFTSVSASAMDSKDLASSQKVLMFFLTNVLAEGMTFTSEGMIELTRNGKLPFLVQVGKAGVTLKNSNPGLKVYAVNFDGSRMGEIPAKYENGAYVFTLEIKKGMNNPAMIFELGK